MVASSCTFIMKLPSPDTSTTVRSGQANCAPIAAGRQAHGAQRAAGQVVARVVEAAVLGHPHLVLADIAGDHRIGRGQLAQALQQRRCVDVLARCVVACGEAIAMLRTALAPRLLVGLGREGRRARMA